MSEAVPEAKSAQGTMPLGMRKNGTQSRFFPSPPVSFATKAEKLTLETGKQWHAPKKAFRPGSGLTSYEKRTQDRAATAMMKAKEKELKDEKEAERQVRRRSEAQPTLSLV